MFINKKLKVVTLIPLLIIILALFIILITTIITDNQSKLQFYKLSGDEIPSVSYVLGERKVSSVSSKTSNSVLYKQYTYYGMDSVIDDIQNYVKYLCNNEEYELYTEINENDIVGQIMLGKNSSNTGENILIIIDYEVGNYTISMEKSVN